MPKQSRKNLNGLKNSKSSREYKTMMEKRIEKFQEAYHSLSKHEIEEYTSKLIIPEK